MGISFLDVLITVFSLVILALPGFILVKTKILKEGADKVLSNIVLYICQPLLVFSSFQKVYNPKILTNILIIFIFAILLHLIMILFAYLVLKNKNNNKKIDVLRFASAFGNVGYMGLPFLKALFNGTPYIDEILIYSAVIIVVMNIMCWSIGAFMISKDKNHITCRRAFYNPTFFSVVIGLIFYFALQKPIAELGTGDFNAFLSKVMISAESLGDMTTPLSMIIIGIKLSSVSFKELFLDKLGYLNCINKLFIMPLITILVVAFLPISQPVKFALFFSMAMPSAASTVLFSVQFDGDAKFATISVLLSTILSIITIPLMFLLSNAIF